MRVEYWDPAEFDCPLVTGGPDIGRADTVHLHAVDLHTVIEGWKWMQRIAAVSALHRGPGHPGLPGHEPVVGGSLLGPPVNCRYVCLRGPGGLVRGILP
jgi:hypothetical protein